METGARASPTYPLSTPPPAPAVTRTYTTSPVSDMNHNTLWIMRVCFVTAAIMEAQLVHSCTCSGAGKWLYALRFSFTEKHRARSAIANRGRRMPALLILQQSTPLWFHNNVFFCFFFLQITSFMLCCLYIVTVLANMTKSHFYKSYQLHL